MAGTIELGLDPRFEPSTWNFERAAAPLNGAERLNILCGSLSFGLTSDVKKNLKP